MKLQADLSASSISKLREAIANYRDSLKALADELCRRLSDIGVQAAVTSIDHDESGELRSSISYKRRGDRDYLVIADCGYAVYVEFGTGVVGAGTSYPGDKPAWAGSPGSRSSHVNPDGSWVYFDEKQARWRITSGQKPQGFMAQSAAEMRRNVLKIAKEVFSA